jgi:hypothetical protein
VVAVTLVPRTGRENCAVQVAPRLRDLSDESVAAIIKKGEHDEAQADDELAERLAGFRRQQKISRPN